MNEVESGTTNVSNKSSNWEKLSDGLRNVTRTAVSYFVVKDLEKAGKDKLDEIPKVIVDFFWKEYALRIHKCYTSERLDPFIQLLGWFFLKQKHTYTANDLVDIFSELSRFQPIEWGDNEKIKEFISDMIDEYKDDEETRELIWIQVLHDIRAI